MEVIASIAALLTIVSLVAVIYPFKPYRSRKTALAVLVGCFVVVGISAPSPESQEAAPAVVAAEQEDDPDVVVALEEQPDAEVVTTSVQTDDIPIEPRTPTESEIQDILALFDAGTLRSWRQTKTAIGQLESENVVTDTIKDELESRMLDQVRPLPVSDIEGNLAGYRNLADLRPDNESYAEKIEFYETKRQEAAERATREREEAERAAIARLNVSEDRVDRITWYQHPNKPRYTNSRSTAYLYIGRRGLGDEVNSGRPWLRMRVQYAASSWLFVNEVTAYHDGVSEPLVAGVFERDNNSTIWEWMDVAPDDYQLEVLRSLANADEASLRFRGQQYHRDVNLSASDKRAIREVLLAFEAMR